MDMLRLAGARTPALDGAALVERTAPDAGGARARSAGAADFAGLLEDALQSSTAENRDRPSDVSRASIARLLEACAPGPDSLRQALPAIRAAFPSAALDRSGALDVPGLGRLTVEAGQWTWEETR